MEEQLVNLIGESDGSEILFDEWVNAARAAKLRPEVIQNLKRRELVYTRLAENGQVWIVRGKKPAQN